MTLSGEDIAVKTALAAITVINGDATGSSPTKVNFNVLSGATLAAGYIADSESGRLPLERILPHYSWTPGRNCRVSRPEINVNNPNPFA